MLVPEVSYSCFQKWLYLNVQRAFEKKKIYIYFHFLYVLLRLFLPPYSWERLYGLQSPSSPAGQQM